MLLRLLKKENIFIIINERNSTKLTNAIYPQYHRDISFMVYAFPLGQRIFNLIYFVSWPFLFVALFHASCFLSNPGAVFTFYSSVFLQGVCSVSFVSGVGFRTLYPISCCSSFQPRLSHLFGYVDVTPLPLH